MIRKLRLKFVAVCMAMVTFVLAVVFFSVYYAARQNTVDLSRQVLHRVIQDETLSAGVESTLRPDIRPDISVTVGGDRVLLPYFTVQIWGGTAYVTGGTYGGLEDTETLAAILQDCLNQDAKEEIGRAHV